MPTAVEQLTSLLKNALSLDAIDTAREQAGFANLSDRFDGDLAALRGAHTPRDFAAAERMHGGDFSALGEGFAQLGGDLFRDASVFSVADQVLARGPLHGATGIQADFASLDMQLAHAGADLARFGGDLAALGHVGSQAQLLAVEAALNRDAGALSHDFAACDGSVRVLSHDLGGSDVSGAQALGRAFEPLGAAFAHAGSDFSQLVGAFGDGGGSGFGARGDIYGAGGGSGFGALVSDIFSGQGGGSGFGALVSDIFSGQGGGSGFGDGGGAGRIGTIFDALNADFMAADASLHGLAQPLACLLLPAVHLG